MINTNGGIAVCGAVFVDIKGFPTGTFIQNGRNMGRIEQVHGGVCRNIAEDIAGMGFRSTMIGLVDNSGAGEDVISRLNANSVNTEYMQKVPDGMGTWLAVFDDKGDVAASISKRPNLMPICDILDESGDEIISACDSLAFEIDIEPEIADRLFGLAEKYNKRVFCAVSNIGVALERRSKFRGIECFVCNCEEAGEIFSADYSELSPEELLTELQSGITELGVNSLVVTMGSQGAVYVGRDCCGVCPAKEVKVIDTTGAGDSFFAGVCSSLTYGKSLNEACNIGAEIAASVISTTENVYRAKL